MFIMRGYILFYFSVAFYAKYNVAISQTYITPTLISSTSGYDTVPLIGWTISYSVGEPAIMTLGPVNNLILTQGFEQPTAKACTITVVPSASPNSICLGESTSLNATIVITGNGGSAIKYLWSPSASINNNTISNPIATPTSLTTYSVIVSAAGCISDTGSVTVAVNTPPTITVSGNKNSCVGDNTVLTANGAAAYNWWNTGETTSAITVAATIPGNITYTVSGTNSNNCKDTAFFTITVRPRPIPVITGNTTICSGQNSILTVSGGNMYLWSTGETKIGRAHV